MDDDVAALVEGVEDERGAARRAPWWRRLRIVLPGLFTTVGGAGITLALIGNAYAGTLPGDAPSAAATSAVQRYVAPAGTQLDDVALPRFKARVTPFGAVESTPVSMPTGPVAPVGTAQEYAASQIAARGWAAKELACLVPMWGAESGWNAHAGRPDGPYGIPQAFPGSKMGAGGGDWLNDYKVQIRWGLGYIAGRYGTPCKAWAHWQLSRSY